MPSQSAIARAIAQLVVTRYPNTPEEETIELLVETWAEDLANLTDAELVDACRRYRQSTAPEDRWWPTPGRILAMSALGRTAAAMGSSADADRAFVEFRSRMAALGYRPDREDEGRHLDPKDPARNDAMFRALESMGGARAWGQVPDENHDAVGYATARRRWTAAYVEARLAQARDPQVVRAALTAATTRALPAPAEAK